MKLEINCHNSLNYSNEMIDGFHGIFIIWIRNIIPSCGISPGKTVPWRDITSVQIIARLIWSNSIWNWSLWFPIFPNPTSRTTPYWPLHSLLPFPRIQSPLLFGTPINDDYQMWTTPVHFHYIHSKNIIHIASSYQQVI